MIDHHGIAMRLLHAGLRRHRWPTAHLNGDTEPRRRAGGQSLPLHRLCADRPRRRGRGGARRCRTGCAMPAPARPHAARRSRPPPETPGRRWPRWYADAARGDAGRRGDGCGPLGDQGVCATCAEVIFLNRCRDLQEIEVDRDGIRIGAGVTMDRVLARDARASPLLRRDDPPLRRRCRCARRRRSAATSPTARPSATTRRR